MSKNDLPPSRTAEQFVVRFPDGMRDRIAEAAKTNNRSMNAEIIARVSLSFEKSAQDGVNEGMLVKAVEDAINRTISIALRGKLEKIAIEREKAGGTKSPDNPAKNKVILVPSIGREPLPAAEKTPPNTGPTRSPNARKLTPKK